MKVIYSKVEESCDQIKIISENMQEILEKITTLTTKLTKGGIWTGEAANNYVKKVNTSIKNFDNIFTGIENSIKFFRNEIDELKSVDQAIMNGYQSDFGLLNPKGFGK